MDADAMSGIGQKPHNSARPLIAGFQLWLRCTFTLGEGIGVTYRDPAFPACPQCGSPNVRLLRTRRKQLNSYVCLDCKSRDTCVVPDAITVAGHVVMNGSTGIERRRAQIKMLVIVAVLITVLLAIVLTGNGSWLGSGGS